MAIIWPELHIGQEGSAMDSTEIAAGRIVIVRLIYRDDNGFYMTVERELDDAIITARQLLVEGRDVRLMLDKEFNTAYDMLLRQRAKVLQ